LLEERGRFALIFGDAVAGFVHRGKLDTSAAVFFSACSWLGSVVLSGAFAANVSSAFACVFVLQPLCSGARLNIPTATAHNFAVRVPTACIMAMQISVP